MRTKPVLLRRHLPRPRSAQRAARTMRCLLAAMLGLACASTPRYPELAGSAAAEIAQAESAIAIAVRAGADSLASEPLASARQNLEKARAELQANQNSRALVAAQMADADARYAATQARLRAAQRDRAKADAEMKAIPPGER